MQKFKSRKFWLAVGTVFSVAIAAATGIQIDPAALAGIIVVISTYIGSQAIVDKSVGAEQVRGAFDTGRLQLEMYAKNLEVEFAKVTNDLEVMTAAATLTVVPDVDDE